MHIHILKPFQDQGQPGIKFFLPSKHAPPQFKKTNALILGREIT